MVRIAAVQDDRLALALPDAANIRNRGLCRRRRGCKRRERDDPNEFDIARRLFKLLDSAFPKLALPSPCPQERHQRAQRASSMCRLTLARQTEAQTRREGKLIGRSSEASWIGDARNRPHSRRLLTRSAFGSLYFATQAPAVETARARTRKANRRALP